MRRLAVLASTAALLLGALVTAPAATAETPPGPEGPARTTFPAALLHSLAHPGATAPGTNDFACRPTDAHPRPVVLVHGTFENAYDNWAELAPALKADGYCLFSLNYGGQAGTAFRGLTDIPASARELDTFVDEVLAATGAQKVDVVGHSQGGMMPRYYLKNLGGAEHVGRLVGLSPSNHGTTVFGLLTSIVALPGGARAVGLACEACVQQTQGSAFNRALDAGGDTVPGVDYTVIQTKFDEVVTPFSNAFLDGDRVDNVLLQDVCPLDATDHLGIAYDPIAIRLVRNALDPSTAQAPSCTFVPPVISSEPA
ncbi:esterase/lipase family protein [Solicola sp. PLA-1-18]|uniref:esterase/lipase family protein n=1 Tax=Solicola sp. PLA-1-18 TaxID=3380532 RepID=UPI003B821F16